MRNTIKLSGSELLALYDLLGAELRNYEVIGDKHYSKMVFALLNEIYEKLHRMTLYAQDKHKLKLSTPQALAFLVHFRVNEHTGQLHDNVVIKMIGKIDQQTQ